MLSLRELFEDSEGKNSYLLSRGLANAEYARANRFMIPMTDIMSQDPWLKRSKRCSVAPNSSLRKRQQIDSFMVSLEEGYIMRLKSGFRLVLDMLGEMSGDDDEVDDYVGEEDYI